MSDTMQEILEPAAEAQHAAEHDGSRPRAALIVNPYASGMTARRERVIVQTLREHMDLQVRRTERSGHAPDIAADLLDSGVDVLISCGGDGTAAEMMNGMDLGNGTAMQRPMVAVIPAGGTNVLCRSLGLPNDPVKATRLLAPMIAARQCERINLGMLDERIFLFSAGVGLDGELIKRMNERRSGRRPGDLAHITSIVGIVAAERFSLRDRMTVHVPELDESLRSSLVMVCNTTPLTYFGAMAMHFMPDCTLTGGLDFVAPRRSSALFMIRNGLQAAGVGRARRLLVKEDAMQLRHDLETFTVTCDEPQPIQADGEYLGERTHITFSVIRDAVRLVH